MVWFQKYLALFYIEYVLLMGRLLFYIVFIIGILTLLLFNTKLQNFKFYQKCIYYIVVFEK